MQTRNKETETEKPIRKKNYIKKIAKICFYIVLVVIVLNISLYGLLSIPSIQKKVVDYVVSSIKEKVNTEVKIDAVNLKLLNYFNVKGFYIEDLSKDTLVYVENVEISLHPWKLLKSQLFISSIELDNFKICISQETPDSDFNFQFLVDAFASDSIEEVTDTNATTNSNSFKIDIENINLKDGGLCYNIKSEPETSGIFNPSHIQISDLNAKLELPSLDLLNLKVNLKHLSFKERSSLVIENLKGGISSKNTTFYLKDAILELPHSTIEIPRASYNMLNSKFNISTSNSVISPLDLSFFMPELTFLRDDIKIKLDIDGQLPAININTVSINYGENSKIEANASISDYTNYDKADLKFDLTHFQLSQEAITDFARLGDSTFVSPDILKKMGTIRMKGNLKGTLGDLRADLEAWAKQGALQMNAKVAVPDTSFKNYSANIKLQTQNFNLASLLDMDEIGKLSGNINLIANQNMTNKKPLQINLIGELKQLEYNKENYKNIPFKAYYNAQKMGIWLDADMPQGKLAGTIDMTQSNKSKVDIDLSVEKLKIDKFYNNSEWKNPLLTMQMKGSIKGLDLKSMEADVVVKDFNFSHDSLTFTPEVFRLKAGKTDNLLKDYIQLSSSIFNANITGNYDFMVFSNEIAQMMNRYLPGMFKQKRRKNKKKNNFNFNLTINNTEELGKILDLPINIIKPLILNGSINTETELLKMSINIPELKYGGDLPIKNTSFNLTNTLSQINLTGKSSIGLNEKDINMHINSTAESDTIKTKFIASRKSDGLNLNIPIEFLGNFELNKKDELNSFIKFNSSYWDIGKLKLMFMPATIRNDVERTSIANLGFMEGIGRMMNKYIGVDGNISAQKNDTLNISFFNSNLGHIGEAFDINNFNAIVNGDIKIASVLDKPEMYTKNLNLSNIILNKDTLGLLKIRSKWSDSDGAILFDANLWNQRTKSTSNMRGLVYPDQDSLRMGINLDRFSLNWLEPFMVGLLNKVSGSISSKLTAMGKISSPNIEGWLGVNDTYFGVDYTNVIYHIADTINITPDKIGFNNLIVEDPNKNKASVDALITHKNFSDIKYKIDAKVRNFMVLNTQSRTDSLFYGKVFANGVLNITGSDEEIKMNMKVKNGKNSVINVQVPQTSDATVYQSVVYINTPPEPENKKKIKIEEEVPLPLKLGVDLSVTPDIALNIVIDPETGDLMQVKGSGLVKFSYDMESETMMAFGDYTVSDGFVKMKLQGLANIAFKIKEGSKLKFNGDPLKTNFDITAYKRVKADLTTLDQSFGLDQSGSPKILVDCVLGITGNMSKMNLTYDISLPEASDDIKQRVKSIISTDEEKVKQFAYLLAMNSFYPKNSGAGSNITDGLLTNIASSALSSGLNAVLGNALGNDWQIGTNISSDDGSFSNMDMSVSLSRKFLDNKLEFNTNLGYRTDQASSNSFIGDFDVSYALSRAIKLKVFNKTNDRYYQQAPTTQGIGVVYTKEAKKFKELFKFFKKKKRRQNRKVKTTSSK